MSRRRLLVAVLLLGLIAAFFALDLGHYLRLEYFRSQQSAIEEFRRANALAAGGVSFLIYVAVTALSLPGAAPSGYFSCDAHGPGIYLLLVVILLLPSTRCFLAN